VTTPAYKRLPGARRGVFTRASAWVAPDHILLVEGSRTSENYKRVYFRDIQALLVMKRQRVLIQAPWLLVPVALFFAVLSLPPAWRNAGWLLLGAALVASLLYLYIAAFFYSCRFYLATAVGNVYVQSVFRLWQARRFSSAIRPVIVAAQTESVPAPAPPGE